MNKQDIFPMYIGKCKVIIGVSAYEYVGLKDDIVWVFSNEYNDYYTYNISDCTLLLKPISEMSEGDSEEHDKYIIRIIHLAKQKIIKHTELQEAINEHQEWLIQHGYAISDELFTLGIARRV